MNSEYTLHAAPWVIPVCDPPIADGAVAFYGNRIAAVDRLEVLQRRFPAATVKFYHRSAITPPLANAHIHLELSHLSELAHKPNPSSFTGWILSLIELREQLGATGLNVEAAARSAADSQYASGASTLVDIGNTDTGRKVSPMFGGNMLAFKEFLGFHSDHLRTNLKRLDAEPGGTLCSAHAVYSTHIRLLQVLHSRAKENGHVMPIHVAEPEAEITMIKQANGEMVDFLKERGFWDEGFVEAASRATGGGTVSLLHAMGILDEHTLCIHSVHLDDHEIELIAATGAKVCLCPGSNRYLRVGKPPVEKIVDAGVLPALGTDSLASNPELSLWREMQLLAEDHPGVGHEIIFAMATLGGAQAVGIAQETGSLSNGRRAEFLKIELPEHITDRKAVLRYLVTTGAAINPVRIMK